MKRSRTAALLLMSATPLLLTACQGDDDVTREGLFTSVDSCAAQTGDRATCQQAFDKSQAEAAKDAPQFASREECAKNYDWDRCAEQKDSGGHSFFGPMMAGFFISQMMRNGSPMAGFNSGPAWRNSAGAWQRPDPGTGGASGVYSGSRAGAKMVPVTAAPDRAMTVTRGGFGSSFGSRSAGG